MRLLCDTRELDNYSCDFILNVGICIAVIVLW